MIVGITGHVHRTWANTFSSHPQRYYQPSEVEQVQEIVRSAVKQGINVVVTGSSHSPSEITMTTGWLLNLDNLSRILSQTEGKGYTDVSVEAGIRLRDLNTILASRGLALQNLGSISDQSVAGVISTGTHGSSYLHGLISEQIVSLDIVTESGDVVVASEKSNPELFQAALLGLGAFGVIVRATIRCVPAFNLESKAFVLDFDELLSSTVWSSVFTEAEFHRIWWYPYANRCYVWQAKRTERSQQPAPYSFYGTRLGRFLYEVLLWFSVKLSPRLTPFVEKWLFEHQFDSSKPTIHVGRSDEEINMDCLFKQFVNEWSFPLVNGPEALRELKKEIYKREFYVHAPIEIRASNTTLPDRLVHDQPGPVYGNITRPLLDPSPELEYALPADVSNNQLTLNLNATLYRPFMFDPSVTDWYTTFETICAQHGGKPHWAKNFIRNPWLEGGESSTSLEKWRKIKEKWAPRNIFGGTEWLSQKGLLT